MNRITSTHHKLFLFIVYLLSYHAVRSEKGAKHSSRAGWEDSTFKGWYFTPHAVVGRQPVARIKHRSYCRIFRKTDGSVTVLAYNPAGIVVSTTVVWYTNGKLRLIAQRGRWNEPLDSIWYRPDGQDEFIVTEKIKGVNPFFPCRAARYTFKNDLLREILFLADTTRPGVNREGVSHCVFERYNDPKRMGLIRSETYFNEIDLPVVSRSMGVHKVINEFDDNANVISRSVFGPDDKPTVDLTGACREKYKYDDDDNEKEIDYFDEKGSLVTTEMGYAQTVRYYSNGFLEKEKYYDENNQLIRGGGIVDSAAIIVYEHDKQGNLTEAAYFGPDEGVVANIHGIHRRVYTYSPEGMLTGGAVFGINSHAVADEYGVHWYKYQRDTLGQITGASFVNKFGATSIDLRDGAFLRKYSYDAWGRCFSTSFWQDESTKTNCVEHYHESVVHFNEDGIPNEADYYDENSRLTSGLMGYSRQRITYNEQGRVEERRFFNGDEPTLVRAENAYCSNFHQIRYEYDITGRLRSLSYYDQERRPLNARIAPMGGKEIHCQRIEFGYDRGRIVDQKIHDSGDISTPVLLDCMHGKCLSPDGYGVRDPSLTVVRNKGYYSGKIRTDSVFYNNELSFINQDSVLLFLNGTRSSLDLIACATFYRVAKLNKFYQFEGVTEDYYLANDSLADRLTYSSGRLNGPCTFFYANGTIQERGTYSNNSRVGTWDYFFENGKKAKTVYFTDRGAFLMDCFNETGEVLAQKGNGRFEGMVYTGPANDQMELKMVGTVKNGLPDGQWTYYNNLIPGPAGVEQFMGGKFLHGTSYSLTGTRTYDRNPLGRVESLHPLEFLDHYGCKNFCQLSGKTITIDVRQVLNNGLYTTIDEGMRQVLKSGRYRYYSGWVLLDLHYDKSGQIVGKSVRLHQKNEAFEKDILAMLDHISDREKLILDNRGTAFEKFIVVLVDANETAIPEELLERQHSISR